RKPAYHPSRSFAWITANRQPFFNRQPRLDVDDLSDRSAGGRLSSDAKDLADVSRIHPRIGHYTSGELQLSDIDGGPASRWKLILVDRHRPIRSHANAHYLFDVATKHESTSNPQLERQCAARRTPRTESKKRVARQSEKC